MTSQLAPAFTAVPFVGVDAEGRPVKPHASFMRWLSYGVEPRVGGLDAQTNLELAQAIEFARQLAGQAMMMAGTGDEEGMMIPGPAGSPGPAGTGAQGPAGPVLFLPADDPEDAPPMPPGPTAPAGLLVGTAQLLSVQALPGNPAAGQVRVFAESSAKRLTAVDDTGRTVTQGLTNWSTSSQGPGFASDTYLVGSAITIPASLRALAGTKYLCRFSLSKTAAGVANPTCIVRIGTTGSLADAAILTFTGAAQTAVTDVGIVDVLVTFRAVGASAVVQGAFSLLHNKGNTVGLSGTDHMEVTSGTFDSTTASLVIGISLNYGASAAITVTQVQAELTNI